MQKKNNRIIHRGKMRQKISRRTILIITASCFTCMIAGLTIFFNTSKVEKSMAASVYMVTEEAPTVEKTLDAPVIRQVPAIGPNTIMMRPLKAERNTAGANSN